MGTSNHTRRNFLRYTAGAGIAAAAFRQPLLRAASRIPSTLGNRLRFPSAFSGASFEVRKALQEVWPGEPIEVWTFGGSYPGPTIRVRRGERFSVDVTNRLDEETTVHWHGLVIPHSMDGHPINAIGTGETYHYNYDVLNRAGTYWYHPHPHGRTAPQTYMGMAGFYIVEDDEEKRLGLPAGERELLVLLQDREAARTHRFEYSPDVNQILNGLMGDAMLANGTPDAYHEVAAGLYRLRLLNGSNARILRPGFSDGLKFHVIGTDGGLLDRPYEVENFMLTPGQRIDLLIDFSAYRPGDSVMLKTLHFANAGTYRAQGFELDMLRFDIVRPDDNPMSIPDTLASLERLDPAQAVRTQIFEFDTFPIGREGHNHWINGKTFKMHRVDAMVPQGDLEIWELRNIHSMPHPVHIHGVQFQVLDRNGDPNIAPEDHGWKDTVLTWGMETVRVILRFAPFTGTYLIHCHNLEHEDQGMMINFDVTEKAGTANEGDTERFSVGTITPNPARREVVLPVELAAPTSLQLLCIGLDGRVVRELNAGSLEPGAHRLRFDVGTLPVGRYLFVVQAGNHRAEQWLSVIR